VSTNVYDLAKREIDLENQAWTFQVHIVAFHGNNTIKHVVANILAADDS